jgi:hypothetical protein
LHFQKVFMERGGRKAAVSKDEGVHARKSRDPTIPWFETRRCAALLTMRDRSRRVVPTVDQHVGPGHEARRIAGEKYRGSSNFVRLTEAAE